MPQTARLLAALGLSLAAAARAEEPALHHLWTIPGLVSGDRGIAGFNGRLDTFFSCTNVNRRAKTVGVEAYDAEGGLVSSVALELGPGATAIFGTDTALGFVVHPEANLDTGPIEAGHARILSSARRRILCSAWIADSSHYTPTSMLPLHVVSADQQRGD